MSATHRRRTVHRRPVRPASARPGTGVLVTGGGSGIGRATALALAEVGRPVAVWDLDGPGAEATATACRDLGVVAHAAVVDVADSEAVAGAVAHGRRRARVHSGGSSTRPGCPGAATVDDIDDAVWDATLNVNLRAAAIIGRHLIAPVPRGRPGVGRGAHLVHRGAVRQLGADRLLRLQGGRPRCDALARPALRPRGIPRQRRAVRGRWSPRCSSRRSSCPGFREQIEAATPLQRVASPDEIAAPIRFLLSTRRRSSPGPT